MWLFVLFLTIPLIEIGLFIQIGGFIGLWPTLAVVVLTAILGTWLVRSQGSLALSQIRTSFNELNDPTEPLAHGAMILIAGGLLLTPGFFTDAIGFSLLVPPVRQFLILQVKSHIKTTSFQSQANFRSQSGTIIDEDGEILDTDPHGPSGWTRH
ncbi:FxsA family protein [Rhodobacterales bacterium HKCCA1058]|nr:FxsA family protein [Rhodobacterales bacterium HKCCA1058]